MYIFMNYYHSKLRLSLEYVQSKMNKRFIEIKETNQELIDYIQNVVTYFQETFNQMSMKFVQFTTLLQPIRNKNRVKQPEMDSRRPIDRIKQTKKEQFNSGIQSIGRQQQYARMALNTKINNKIKKTKSNIVPPVPHNPHDEEMFSFPLNQQELQTEDYFNNSYDIKTETHQQPNYNRSNRDYTSQRQRQLQKDSFVVSQRQDLKRFNPDVKNEELDKFINDRWSKMTFYERKEEIDKLKIKRQLQNAKNLLKKINNQQSKPTITHNDKFNNLLNRGTKKQGINEIINIQDSHNHNPHQHQNQHSKQFKIDIKDLRQAVSQPQKNHNLMVNENKNSNLNNNKNNEPSHNFLSDYSLGDFNFD